MWVIFVEAAGAMLLFVFIVWWTMFSGQKPTLPEKPMPKQDEIQK